MTNADVARVFEEIADLMEIAGEDGFRVSSYRRVARTVGDLGEQIVEIASRGGLEKLPGIGKSSAEKIVELLKTGKVSLRESLMEQVPPSLLEILRIPGLGPKKAAVLWREVGVDSLESLKGAIDAGKLKGVKGFADRTIASIREGIDFVARSAGRTRLGEATQLAELLRKAIARFDGVERVESAGSLRRGADSVGDLDLLCIAPNGPRVIEQFTTLPGVARVLVCGETKGSIIAHLDAAHTIQIDLRVVPAESFGAAWQYFTGSKQHNVRLREMANQRGWTLNEYALAEEKTGKVIASKTEEEIYAAFGMAWIPPELREDRGEFDAPPPKDLLALGDIRGDLHMHTTASDGLNTIDEMVAAARQRGYSYVCITDHSQSSVIANGLKPDRLREHIAAVRAVAAKSKGITVWVGSEVDILADGRLDYPDDLLAQLDWVVASIHAGQSKDIARNTERTLAAIRNPYVCCIGHPTGRLINERDAMPLDIEAIASEAARTGTALEINASAGRLDLRDQHARLARDRGAMICIDCDAHAVGELDQMPLGVATARRAWLRKQEVLNTRSAKDVAAFVAAKRKATSPAHPKAHA